MTVTPDRTARAARAGEALMARHAELQEVLDQWAGVLAAAADSGRPVHPARNLLRAFLDDELLPHIRAEERTRSQRDDRAALVVTGGLCGVAGGVPGQDEQQVRQPVEVVQHFVCDGTAAGAGTDRVPLGTVALHALDDEGH